MSIGEKIIAAIAQGRLVKAVDPRPGNYEPEVIFVWSQSAAEQLEAVVEAHIQERIEAALEEERNRYDLPGGEA